MRPLLPIVLSAGLVGCGYPGEPLPPALRRPVRVVDLSVVERGEKLDVRFTMPKETSEGLKIKGAPDVEVRIGPLPEGAFSDREWAARAERVPEASIAVAGGVASAHLPAAKYYGKTLVAGVRVHGPEGRDLGWSNFQTVTVVPALATPEGLEATDAPDAVKLEWHAAAPEFRVFRKVADEKEWGPAVSVSKPAWVDDAIEYGKTYEYYVVAMEKSGAGYAESEASRTISFKPVDRFAPAVPAGLTAVPGPRTIELVWERNAEKDFAGYRVYRDGMRVGADSPVPAYTDRDAKPGTRYRYQVSAVDKAGNESARCAAVDAAIPQ